MAQKKTQAEKKIEQINQLRQDGRLTQKEAQSLRQDVKAASTPKGDLKPAAQKSVSAAVTAAATPARKDQPASGGPNPKPGSGGGSGSGGSGSGSGGGGNNGGGSGGGSDNKDKRPPAPGAAWVWSPARDKWIRPPAPGDGKHMWDDDRGWVLREDTGGGDEEEEGQQETFSCEAMLGLAQEGFRWEGSYVKNPDGSVSNTCRLVAIEEEKQEDEPEDTSARDAQRRQAKDMFRSVLQGMGFTTDFGFTQAEINQLYASVEGWISDGWADGYDGGEKMLMLFRTSDTTKNIYQKRFPGMQSLSSRGQAISEGEYIELERSYRNVLSASNLPPQFYDSFDDYGRFIAGGVSANEVEGRIVAARTAMNPAIARELQDYYGIGEDKAMAFLLGLTDEKGLLLDAQKEARNQQTIRDISRNIQIGGLAEGAGFRMGLSDSSALSGTNLGQTIDPFDQRTASQLEGTFAQARRTANRETVLAGIDQEGYQEQDTLLAAFGNDQKRLASERRAKRERARFSGSSGVAGASLGVERNL